MAAGKWSVARMESCKRIENAVTERNPGFLAHTGVRPALGNCARKTRTIAPCGLRGPLVLPLPHHTLAWPRIHAMMRRNDSGHPSKTRNFRDMQGLRYEAPTTIEAAVALLTGAPAGSRILAGGTDVIVQMETDLIEPPLLVDIKKIAELKQITQENGGFRVGAAAPGMDIVRHAAFCKAWPGIIDGVKLIGSIQVKGRASIGGNLCNGSPAADSVPAIIAAGAIARVIGPNGVREVKVETIPVGPGKTSLAKGEFIASFFLPP